LTVWTGGQITGRSQKLTSYHENGIKNHSHR
jgi:hypothetical protein